MYYVIIYSYTLRTNLAFFFFMYFSLNNIFTCICLLIMHDTLLQIYYCKICILNLITSLILLIIFFIFNSQGLPVILASPKHLRSNFRRFSSPGFSRNKSSAGNVHFYLQLVYLTHLYTTKSV